MKESEIHVGKLIESVLNSRKITKAEFARRINTSRQNITTLLKRPNMDVKQLFTISQALDYDFMQHFLLKKPEPLPETEVNIRLKVKSAGMDDLMQWISENGNIHISRNLVSKYEE